MKNQVFLAMILWEVEGSSKYNIMQKASMAHTKLDYNDIKQ